jgi:hypothetical protein
MRTRLKLKPGARRTKKLAQEYGDRLICVRYRYDALRQKRYKTVELVVDEVPWQPASGVDPEQIVPLRIGFDEKDLQQRVKAAGGRWDAKAVVWRLTYSKVTELGIRDRIVEESGIRAFREAGL